MTPFREFPTALQKRRERPRIRAVALAAFLTVQLVPLNVASQTTIDLDSDAIAEWTIAESLRIGSHDGEWDAFHRVSGVRNGPDGTVLILDYGIPAIRVFDRDGSFLRQIGSRGEGPGELLAPSSWGVDGDRIWIADQRLARLMVYSVDGELESDRRLDPNTTGRRPAHTPILRLPDGGFLAVSPSGPDLSGADPGQVEFEQYLVRLDEALRPVETMRSHTIEFSAISLGGGGIWGFNPFPDRPLVIHESAERSVVVNRRPAQEREESNEFSISAYDEAGEVLSRRFRYEPVAIPAPVRDSLLAAAEEGLPSALPAAQREATLELVRVPRAKPPVSAAHLTVGGDLWLERERSEDRTRWLVLDGELRPVAQVSGPPGVSMRLESVMEDDLWVVEEDEFGVQYVVRYRITRSSR